MVIRASSLQIFKVSPGSKISIPILQENKPASSEAGLVGANHACYSGAQPVDSIKRSSFVTLRQGGIVEHVINKVFHFPLKCHNRLPNVNELTGSLANDMYAQQLMGVEVKDQFQQPRLIADDLSAGNLTVLGLAYFIRNPRFGQFFLAAAHRGNLGDRINTVREK